MDNRQFIFDSLLNVKASGAVTASAAATALAAYIDLGGGFTKGALVLDVTAIGGGAASGNRYSIVLQASDTTTFTKYVPLARLVLGQPITSLAEYIGGNLTPAVGRYILPWCNLVKDTLYRYIRVYTTVTGTSSKSVTYAAFISKWE